MLKNSPANAKYIEDSGFDPWVRKIPLEEGMTTQPSILTWRIPWTEEPSRLQSIGSQRVRRSELAHTDSQVYWLESCMKHEV